MGNPSAASSPTPAPVIVLRVTVRADDLEAFIEKYARHIDGDRIFIFTKNPQPVGTRVKFTLQLQSGEQLLHGKGTVTRIQEPSSDRRHPPGMELVFVALDDRSQTLIDFMLAARAEEAPPIVRAVVASPKKPPPTPSAVKAPPPMPAESWLPPPTASEPAKPTESAKAKGSDAKAPDPKAPTLAAPAKSDHAPLSEDAPEPATKVDVAPLELPPPPSPTPSVVPSFLTKPPVKMPSFMASPPVVSGSPASDSAAQDLAAMAASATALPATAPPATEPPAIEPPAIEPPAIAPLEPAPPIDEGEVDRPSSIALKIAEAVPPTASAPVAPGPAPAMFEKWRDPLPPGMPAAGTDGNVPANPFTEVPDSAIDYFVEWSLEQSIGPRTDPSSKFSDVPMSLPGTAAAGADDVLPSTIPKKLLAVGGGAFAAGLLLGVGIMLAVRPSVRPAPAVEATASAAPAPAPAAAPEPAPAPAAAPEPAEPEEATAEGALSVVTRPPGAQVSVDGKPMGTTPLSAKVAPGKHEVSISKERYTTIESKVEAPGKLSLELKRPPATLRVTSNPAGADVTVAGVPHGKTPASMKLPAYESYEVQITLPGARPWHKSVYLSHTSNEVSATLVGKTAAKKVGQR
jgi:hypothetical protein